MPVLSRHKIHISSAEGIKMYFLLHFQADKISHN